MSSRGARNKLVLACLEKQEQFASMVKDVFGQLPSSSGKNAEVSAGTFGKDPTLEKSTAVIICRDEGFSSDQLVDKLSTQPLVVWALFKGIPVVHDDWFSQGIAGGTWSTDRKSVEKFSAFPATIRAAFDRRLEGPISPVFEDLVYISQDLPKAQGTAARLLVRACGGKLTKNEQDAGVCVVSQESKAKRTRLTVPELAHALFQGVLSKTSRSVKEKKEEEEEEESSGKHNEEEEEEEKNGDELEDVDSKKSKKKKNSSSTNKCELPRSQFKKIVVALSGLEPTDRDVVDQALRSGMRSKTGYDVKIVSDEFARAATHVIVSDSTPTRTLKVLGAIARGAWVVKASWVLASIDVDYWVRENEHEAYERFPGCRSSREALDKSDSRAKFGLLAGYKVHVLGGTKAPVKAVQTISSFCGAKGCDSLEESDIIIAGAAKAKKVLGKRKQLLDKVKSDSWLFDSIESGRIKLPTLRQTGKTPVSKKHRQVKSQPTASSKESDAGRQAGKKKFVSQPLASIENNSTLDRESSSSKNQKAKRKRSAPTSLSDVLASQQSSNNGTPGSNRSSSGKKSASKRPRFKNAALREETQMEDSSSSEEEEDEEELLENDDVGSPSV